MKQLENNNGIRLACVVMALLLPAGLAAAETVYYLRADVTTLTVSGDVDIPMWGFALDNSFEAEDGEVTIPGPRLNVPAGDSLTIYLKNKLTATATGFGADVPVSIVIPGQTAVMTPVRWESGEYAGRIRSMTHETAAGNATAIAYSWPSVKPGTYVYQSGTHVQVQVQMGLCGCLTVDAAPGEAYPGITYDREAVLIYTEIDPALHNAVATGNYGPGKLMSSTVNYAPRYYLVNGLESAPDSSPIQTAQRYERVLLRFVNLGLKSHVPSLLDQYMDLIAEDGSPYSFAREQYSVLLPANKTMDAILVPQTPGNLPIFDRMLALSADEPGVGGLFARIQVDEDVVAK